MRKDIMVDIETLGTESDSTIIQLSALSFDINSGEVFNSFNKVANIEKNTDVKVTGSTIKWWLKTDPNLLSTLLNENDDISSEELIREFHDWLTLLKQDGSVIHLWGNGILFDNQIIKYQMESIGLAYPVYYSKDRDVRTIVDLACAKIGASEKALKSMYADSTLVKHNAYDDVIYQIRLVVSCYNLLVK